MTQPATPADLPAAADVGRWPFLQRLRREQGLDVEPWLLAIEAGSIPLESDLVAVLAGHLDGVGASRLLGRWLRDPQPDPAIPALIGERRDPRWAALLRQVLTAGGEAESTEHRRAHAAAEPGPQAATAPATVATMDSATGLASAPGLAATSLAATTGLPSATAVPSAATAVPSATTAVPSAAIAAFGSATAVESLAVESLAVALLPLLGHQRDPADFLLLRQRLLEPAPLAVRLAALEGLCRGLSAWPLPPLRTTLAIAARDLQPRLAAAALDALARLPGARRDLLQLARPELAPEVEQRRRRRLQALPAAPLLLLAHGRAGGELPAELQDLAAEVARRRGAPVALQLLTSSQIPSLPADDPAAPPLTLVPLLLFPGNHVRSDLPTLVRHLRHQGALRRLPFLGAWRSWQRALAQETAALITASPSTLPLLLHHPLEGPLADRYLAVLAGRCGGRCLAAGPGSLPIERNAPCLPLALASNRLTDSLRAGGWDPAASRPLLARDHLRQVLLEKLVALP